MQKFFDKKIISSSLMAVLLATSMFVCVPKNANAATDAETLDYILRSIGPEMPLYILDNDPVVADFLYKYPATGGFIGMIQSPSHRTNPPYELFLGCMSSGSGATSGWLVGNDLNMIEYVSMDLSQFNAPDSVVVYDPGSYILGDAKIVGNKVYIYKNSHSFSGQLPLGFRATKIGEKTYHLEFKIKFVGQPEKVIHTLEHYFKVIGGSNACESSSGTGTGGNPPSVATPTAPVTISLDWGTVTQGSVQASKNLIIPLTPNPSGGNVFWNPDDSNPGALDLGSIFNYIGDGSSWAGTNSGGRKAFGNNNTDPNFRFGLAGTSVSQPIIPRTSLAGDFTTTFRYNPESNNVAIPNIAPYEITLHIKVNAVQAAATCDWTQDAKNVRWTDAQSSFRYRDDSRCAPTTILDWGNVEKNSGFLDTTGIAPASVKKTLRIDTAGPYVFGFYGIEPFAVADPRGGLVRVSGSQPTGYVNGKLSNVYYGTGPTSIDFVYATPNITGKWESEFVVYQYNGASLPSGTLISSADTNYAVMLNTLNRAPIIKKVILRLNSGPATSCPIGQHLSAGVCVPNDACLPPLTVNSSGVCTGPAPTVVASHTDITKVSAKLNAVITNPRPVSDTSGWFDWGLTPSLEKGTLNFSTVITGANFSDNLSGLSPNTTYYYRASYSVFGASAAGVPAGSSPFRSATMTFKTQSDVLTCPAGQHISNGVCVPDTLTCPAGQHVSGTACVCDDPSKILQAGVCVDPPVSARAGIRIKDTSDTHAVNGVVRIYSERLTGATAGSKNKLSANNLLAQVGSVTVATLPATNITSTSAKLNGTITGTGWVNKPYFYIFNDSWSFAGTFDCTTCPSATSGGGAFSLNLTNLTPSTRYSFNTGAFLGGTSYATGPYLNFTTLAAGATPPANPPASSGASLRYMRAGQIWVIPLLEPNDPQASHVRLKIGDTIKAMKRE